jgi:hypothetical protein
MLQQFRRYLVYKVWTDGFSIGKSMLYWGKFIHKIKIFIFETDIKAVNCENPSAKHTQPSVQYD